MNKITFAVVVLLAATMFAAGSMFSACGSGSSGTGTAGTTGAAGTGAAGTTGTAGTTGAAGTGSSNNDGGFPAMAADGKCVSGAFSHDGICSCQPDTPLICSAGCTNKNTDPDNCGGCGTKCGVTATCQTGACGAAPATIIPGATGCAVTVGTLDLGLSIAIAGTNIIVADAGHGTVKSYPVAGGTAGTMIAMGEMAPHAVAANGTTVVWINSVAGATGDGGLKVITATLRKSLAGAAAATLATGMNEAGGIQGLVLSADGATVYFASGTAINSIPVAGTTVTNVGNEDHGGLPGALALDGTKLAYPTGLNGDVDILTIKAGSVGSCGINDAMGELDPTKQVNCLRIARSQGSLVLGAMLAKSDRAYWADGTNLKGNDTGANAMQSNDNIAQSPKGDIKGLAMSADKIYFAHDDVIERTPIVKDSTAQPIARGQKTPVSLAVDATKVYWGNNGDCSVAATGL